MTRRETIATAKSMIAHHGPLSSIEFGAEIAQGIGLEPTDELMAEVEVQAIRVLKFLGLVGLAS